MKKFFWENYLKFDPFRIDEQVKQNLINIVNLFSIWSDFNV